MNPFIAEFIGTTLLVLFGNGVVANVVLARTKGNNSGWIVITAGWAFAVFVGVFCSQKFSGAHLNPAVTFAMAAAGKLAWSKAFGYVLAQILGGGLGASLVFVFYKEPFKVSEHASGKRACVSHGPHIRHIPHAFFCQA